MAENERLGASTRMVNMFGRFAWLTTVIVAALSPVSSWAQGYDAQMPSPYSLAGHHQYGPPPMAGGPYSAPAPGPDAFTYGRTRYTELPDDHGWGYGPDTSFERFVKEAFRHGYFRLEYLNWNIKDPGQDVLGAPILSPILDPNNIYLNTRIPFQIFNQGVSLGDGPLAGFGVSPTLDQARLATNDGIRGTWGVQLEPFAVEASVFALRTARVDTTAGDLPITQILSTDILGNPLPPVNFGTFVAQGVLVNGVPGRTAYLIYDDSYQATLRSGVWGSEANLILDAVNAGEPCTIQPIIGFKFVNFSETLTQFGTFRDPLVTGNDIQSRTINATTMNYLYGPQIGTRIEMGHPRLMFGFQPKMMFGINTYSSALQAANTRTNTTVADNPQNLKEKDTTFGPVADLQVYARGKLTEHMTVFVGYNLMWAGLITRPSDNIVYNVNQAGGSVFFQDVHLTDLVLQGVSVGGELTW
jgi:hypothetical protein